MNTENLVREALKEKNPALFKELSATGQLSQFVTETADEIRQQITDGAMAMMFKQGWNSLPPMERVQKMNAAQAMMREIVLAEMLEFPQDDEDAAS